MLPSLQEAVFCFDAENGLTADNRWRDSSKNGLHAQPQNYVAPSYGFSRGPSGAARVTFDGATQRWTLPLRFWDYMVNGHPEYTFAVAARWNTSTGGDRIFDASDAALVRRFDIRSSSTGSAERLMVIVSDAAGVTHVVYDATDVPLTSRTRSCVFSVRYNAAAAPVAWNNLYDGGIRPGYLTSATIGYPRAFDRTAVPTVGTYPTAGGGFFDGDIYYLALWPRIFSNAEAVDMSAMLRDRM